MLFFKKKKSEDWSDFLKIVELLKVNFVELTKKVDMIEEKLRSPIIKKKIQEPKEQEDQEKPIEMSDGLDQLRQARL